MIGKNALAGNICFCLLIVGLLPLCCSAQQYDTASAFSQPVKLDSFVVKSGFDINAFIRRVKSDTTFYKAFKNLHFIPYDAENNIEVFDNDNHVRASMRSKTKQEIIGKCRSTRTIKERECKVNCVRSFNMC